MKTAIHITAAALICACTVLPSAAQSADTLHAVGPWGVSAPVSSTVYGQAGYGAEEFMHTPSSTTINALTGRIKGLEVLENNGDFYPYGVLSLYLTGTQTTLASRGMSNMLCIVDDVPVPYYQLILDPCQIESVTLLSEVAARALYGHNASLGALLIKTKRGSYSTPVRISAYADSGISSIDRMPEWVGAADYARLNNSARAAAGQSVLYDDEAIAGFELGNAYDRRYPAVDYRSMMVRSVTPVSRAGFTMSGGTSRVRYNAALSSLYEGGITKVGPDNDFTRVNLSTSVSTRINDWLEAQISAIGTTSWRRGATGGDAVSSWRSVPANAFPLAIGSNGGVSDVDGQSGATIWAVSRQNTTNPYAAIVDGGSYTGTYRAGLFQANLNADLDWLLKGLKSRTMLSLDTFYYTSVGQSNDYIAYYWDRTDDITDISGHKGVHQSGKSTRSTSSWQNLNFSERLSWDRTWGRHKVGAAGLFTMYTTGRSGTSQRERSLDAIATLDYSFADKYIVNFVGDWAGSPIFPQDNRIGFFPSGGVAWVVSREPWMRSVRAVDYLKIRAQAGLQGTDRSIDFLLYNADYSLDTGNTYGPSTVATQWFGGERRSVKVTTINRLANPDLTWTKVKEYEVGADASLWGCLEVSGTYYRRRMTDMVTDITASLSNIYGLSDITVYGNYTAQSVRGAELSIDWTRKWGDWKLRLGADAMHWKTIQDKLVSDYTIYPWEARTGKESGAIWGYVCTGRFTSEEEIASSATYSSGTQVGDLKYQDLNGDGVIDTNDRKVIGSSVPKLRYSLRLNLEWRRWDLSVVGTGRAFFKTALTNEYFWNGWGDDNYSKFVLDNIGGDYPRLSWDKPTDNFLASTFWLRDGGWFKLKNAEVGYSFHIGKAATRVYLSAANLLTLTDIPYVDPENTSSGVTTYPHMHRIVAGMQLKF